MKWWLHVCATIVVSHSLVAMQTEEGYVEVPEYGAMWYKKVSYPAMKNSIPLMCADTGYRDLRAQISALVGLANEFPLVVYVPLAASRREYESISIPEKIFDPLLKKVGRSDCLLLGSFDGAVQIGYYTTVQNQRSSSYPLSKKISRIVRSKSVVDMDEWVSAVRLLAQSSACGGDEEGLEYSFDVHRSPIVNQFFYCDYSGSCFELLSVSP